MKYYLPQNGGLKLVGVLGQKGGIYAGDAGKVAADKFNGITGLVSDKEGSLYVSSTRSGGELRKFAPDKKLLWHLMGLAFVDGASIDPATLVNDRQAVYMKDEKFLVDFTKYPVTWTYDRYTRDFRRPEEFIRDHLASNLVRRIGGEKIMFCTGMFPQEGLSIFRFENEMAVPSVHIQTGYDKTKKHSAGIWRDSNGDGKKNDDEFTDIPQTNDMKPFISMGDSSSWNWFVDNDGGIWKAYNTAGILNIPCQGLDKKKNPVYDVSKRKIITMPDPFIELNSVEYDTATGDLFVGGEVKGYQRQGADGWGPTIRVLARYDKEMRLCWLMPVDTVNCNSMSYCGEYVFLVDSRSAQIQIFSRSDGLKIGTAGAGKLVDNHSGWIDFPMALRSAQLKDGSVVALVEEDLCAKIMIYRFQSAMHQLAGIRLTKDAQGNIAKAK